MDSSVQFQREILEFVFGVVLYSLREILELVFGIVLYSLRERFWSLCLG